jgi:glycosyltransferase involved in cell wall biosynthesis
VPHANVAQLTGKPRLLVRNESLRQELGRGDACEGAEIFLLRKLCHRNPREPCKRLPTGTHELRILKISQSYYPFLEAGGPPTKIRAIASRLAQHGHQVTVLTSDLGLDQHDSVPSNLNLKRGRWGWQAEDGGVETIYLRSLARYRALTLNPDILSFCRERMGNIDVTHIYGLYDLLGPTVARECDRRGIPYVLEPIGMYRPILRSLRLKRMYHRVLGVRLIHGAEFLIATSEQEKQELLAGGVEEQRVVVRRNGIDAPARLPEAGQFRLKWKIPAEAKVILFLGRIIAKKSPEMLIHAFADWRAKAGPNIPSFLVVAGPEEETAYLRALKKICKKLNVEEIVRFTGPLYGDAKWAAYRDADVFVLASQNENFGNAAAESAACGTPVIVTDQCGIAPIMGGRAGIVVQHSAQALEQALASLLSDPRLREAFRDGCVTVTRELSWAEPVAQMERLYEQCSIGAASRSSAAASPALTSASKEP